MATLVKQDITPVPSVDPTSWTDLDMDWDNIDPMNPVYLVALRKAIVERLCVIINSLQNRVGNPYVRLESRAYGNFYTMAGSFNPYDVYRTTQLTFLRECIFYIVQHAYIKSTVDGVEDYRKLSDSLNHGEAFQNLSMPKGLPINDPSGLTGKFFQALKHLLDQCTIFEVNDRYVYDSWEVPPSFSSGLPPFTSWSELWSAMDDGAATETDIDSTYRPGSTIESYTSYDYMYGLYPDQVYELHYRVGVYNLPTVCHNVKLINTLPLSYDLLFYNDANFDFAGYGGDLKTWGNLITIEPNSTTTLGSAPVTQPPWNPDGLTPNDYGEFSVPYYQSFRCFADYGVEGGLQFY